MSELYEKHNYLNKDISFLCNTQINEYDMKAGGFSILKRAGALTAKEIDYLEKCSKLERNVYLGNKLRANPELTQIQMDGFIEARRQFFERNNIDDNSVLTIKKDAIFLIRSNIYNTQFDGFDFRLANTYNSYYYFPNVQGDDIEMYYKSKDNMIDCHFFSVFLSTLYYRYIQKICNESKYESLKNLSDESLFDLLRSFQITERKDYYFPNFENNQMQQDIQKLFNVNISNEIMKKAYLTKEFKKSFSK